MSALGDLRSKLEKIYDMMPLSDRELTLAIWVLWGDSEISIMDEIAGHEAWWGPKAVEAAHELDRLENERLNQEQTG